MLYQIKYPYKIKQYETQGYFCKNKNNVTLIYICITSSIDFTPGKLFIRHTHTYIDTQTYNTSHTNTHTYTHTHRANLNQI